MPLNCAKNAFIAFYSLWQCIPIACHKKCNFGPFLCYCGLYPAFMRSKCKKQAYIGIWGSGLIRKQKICKPADLPALRVFAFYCIFSLAPQYLHYPQKIFQFYPVSVVSRVILLHPLAYIHASHVRIYTYVHMRSHLSRVHVLYYFKM